MTDQEMDDFILVQKEFWENLTTTETDEVGKAMESLKLVHRDVVIAIALALLVNTEPFWKQLQMLEPVNQMLSDMGIVKVLSDKDLVQYLKVARRAGLVDSQPNSDNRAQNLVALTAVGECVPGKYLTMISPSAVDPADISLVQWYFHRKRVSLGDRLAIHSILMELRKNVQFARGFDGASLAMLKGYTLNIIKSPVFSQQLEVSEDGESVLVFGSLKLF